MGLVPPSVEKTAQRYLIHMAFPSVSVIIPTYNRAHVLRRAINSVFTQEGSSFELIIVDDGSTDETAAMIDRLSKQHSEIKYLHQPNKGPAAARNLGIQNSRAKLISFLDSDDEWKSGKIDAQIRFFKKNPDCLICQTEEIWIRNGKRVNPMKKHQKFGGWIYEKCLSLCVISPSAVMMHRTIFDETGLFDESFPACEDYDLWLRISAKYQVGLIDEAFVIKYGGHEDQLSRTIDTLDRYRVYAMMKMLQSGILTQAHVELTFAELRRKCQIVLEGAKKRGNAERIKEFEKIIIESGIIKNTAGV